MSQIVLPLSTTGPARIVLGSANAHVAEALAAPETWPFRTAVLLGPPRSGKSLFARWFAESGGPREFEAVDDAHRFDEAQLFHRWNRAQEAGTPLLLIGGEPPWQVALPDLRSRLGAALQLEIGVPDDVMAADLLHALAAQRGLALGAEATDYLLPRAGRAFADLEKLVAALDRISLERKVPATHSIWRAALEAVHGPDEPRLL
jgi:hypothetical protein